MLYILHKNGTIDIWKSTLFFDIVPLEWTSRSEILNQK